MSIEADISVEQILYNGVDVIISALILICVVHENHLSMYIHVYLPLNFIQGVYN